MDQYIHLEAEQGCFYYELNMSSSDAEETFSGGVSSISSVFEEKMMDVKAQLLAMNIDAQMSTPVAVRERQMTVEHQDESVPVFTPLRCGGPYSGNQPLQTRGQGQQTAGGSALWNHLPMSECCNLIPFVDAPLLPPDHERGFMFFPFNDLSRFCCQPEEDISGSSNNTHTRKRAILSFASFSPNFNKDEKLRAFPFWTTIADVKQLFTRVFYSLHDMW